MSLVRPSLQRYRLDGIRTTGRTVGDGAFATVLEYVYRGLKCVGKNIHLLLFEHASPSQRADMLRRFEEECELLSRLHHPNVVQFLGVHVEPDSLLPVLVMEYLPAGNLSGYLDKQGTLPDNISYSILRDVALGLRYLHEHTPPIIHRDLSANNVLLTTSLSAKISDLGVAKILNLSPFQMTQHMSTKAPGTPCYMPPEALINQPNYTIKIDSYSFGVMILHVLCGQWPFPDDLFQRDPANPGALIPVTEVNRRERFLQQIGRDHPLSGLIRQCLSNTPAERPDAANLLQQVSTAMAAVLAPAQTVIQQLEAVRQENQTLRREVQIQNGEIQTLTVEAQALSTSNQQLTSLSRRLESEISELRQRVEALSSSGHSCSLGEDLQQLQITAPPVQPVLSPETRLEWRQCGNTPIQMFGEHVVVIGEDVYAGRYGNRVFKYCKINNSWSELPCSPVRRFGMAQFKNRIITVGGLDQFTLPTAKLFTLSTDKRWETFIPPMPTARQRPSVITTATAIVAAGGSTSRDFRIVIADVEVYSDESQQWYKAEPLPVLRNDLPMVAVNDVCYLTWDNNFYSASISAIIQQAVSPTPPTASSGGSVWKPLPLSPLENCSLVSLRGSLVAMGGDPASSAVYVFFNDAWERLVNGDLPTQHIYGVAQLSRDEVILIGGERFYNTFIGIARSL